MNIFDTFILIKPKILLIVKKLSIPSNIYIFKEQTELMLQKRLYSPTTAALFLYLCECHCFSNLYYYVNANSHHIHYIHTFFFQVYVIIFRILIILPPFLGCFSNLQSVSTIQISKCVGL